MHVLALTYDRPVLALWLLAFDALPASCKPYYCLRVLGTQQTANTIWGLLSPAAPASRERFAEAYSHEAAEHGRLRTCPDPAAPMGNDVVAGRDVCAPMSAQMS
jgi:hypothetical protein